MVSGKVYNKKESWFEMIQNMWVFMYAGLNRSAFDNKTVSFEEHIKSEHNMWHYLYFIVLVKVKDPTEFTGPESYVHAMVKASILDWFPRLRAMSLAAIDASEEQIELRSLQAHLETTQMLVAGLSQQLMEMKDQVCTNTFIKIPLALFIGLLSIPCR